MICISAVEEMEQMWPCFECNERFVSSEELQKHLNVHDNERVSWTLSFISSDIKICVVFMKSVILVVIYVVFNFSMIHPFWCIKCKAQQSNHTQHNFFIYSVLCVTLLLCLIT